MSYAKRLIGSTLFILLAANLYAQTSGGGGGGVTQLLAGTNITLSPTNGQGAVTITASSTAATAFSAITAGTNASALLMGTGGSLGVSGSGTIAATSVPFSGILSGTNLGQGLVCGNGCVLSTAGTGFINANELNGIALSGLTTGLLKNTTATGVPTIALAGTDYLLPTGSATGLSKASAAAFGVSECDNTTITCAGGIFTAVASGSSAFSALTNGTNTTAAMLVGTGASLGVSGSGTITATAMPASGLTGTTLPSGIVASSLTSLGTITSLTAATITDSGITGSTQCVQASTSGVLSGTGSACGSGGSTAFSALTGSTNTTAAMVIGTGASLAVSGTGTITATAAPLAGLTGLGVGVGTFLGTPTSANLATAVSDETGTGALVFGTAPTITLANSTGLPISSGVSGLATGIATFLATPTSANLAAAVTNETGTGLLVFATAPTMTLTNATGLPISTGVSGLGTGVATFLATASSANLAAALTDETGTGVTVFSASPALTGTPTAPTATLGTNTTQLATTAFVLANAGSLPDCTDTSTVSFVCTVPISAPSYNTTGATPGAVSVTAGTGSIPALTANSAGFAAPVTGGTAWLGKLPATITAGLLHFAAPGTVDGVNESAITSSLVAIADFSASGTASSTTFLRGDNTWATPAGSGTVTSIATTGPITGGTITTTGTIACATCGVTGSPLSQFAATTSAQLAGVISDETGTGVAVFSTTPTLVTPVLGAATATSLLASGNVDGTAPVTITTGTTATLGGTFRSGYTLNQEATAATAVAYTLPTAAAGRQYCIGNSWNGTAATTGVLTLNTSATGQFIIFTDGTLSATGGNVTSGGAAGDAACFVGVDATHWQMYTQRGTWVKH